MYFAARKSMLLAVGVALFVAATFGCRQEQPATTTDGAIVARSDGRPTADVPLPKAGGGTDAKSALAAGPAKTDGNQASPAGPSLPIDSGESSRVSKTPGAAPTSPMLDQTNDGHSPRGQPATADRVPASDAEPEPNSGSEPRILPAVGAVPVPSSATTPSAAEASMQFSESAAQPAPSEMNPLRQGDRGIARPISEAVERSSDLRGAEPSGRFSSSASAGAAGSMLPGTGASPDREDRRLALGGPPVVAHDGASAGQAASELHRRSQAERGTSPAADRPASESRSPLRLPAGDSTAALRLVVNDPSADRPAGPDSSAAKAAGIENGKPSPPKRKGKHSGEHFDPIKENGPIFEGWPKPQLALIITGREEGYIEPCGCAGLDRMKGGMARRQTLFRTLRSQGWEVVGLDVGGLARGFGKQAELKFQTMVEAKRRTGYDAVAFGTTDLRLPAGELAAVAASADGSPSMFVATNVGLFGFDAGVVPRSKIIERPGARLGVLAVVGKQTQQAIHNDEIEMVDAESAVKQILPELKKKANYVVLLAHMPTEEAEALARKFPEINMVATSGGPAEPPAKPSFIEGTKTIRVEVGEKGMNAVVIAFFDDPKNPIRYQRVPLDSRFEGSAEMKALLTAYQDQLRTLGWAGLNIRALPHPQTETNGKFIGSKKCESCHEESTKVWKRTGHSRAFATLENLDPPRHHDPECVSCHVIGWHPTKYFPYEKGFVSKEKTPELIDVGCESCHGPGEKHAAAEIGADLELQKRLRQAMVVTKEESAKRQCYTCHDLDNSPDFEFESYWPIVEHYED